MGNLLGLCTRVERMKRFVLSIVLFGSARILGRGRGVGKNRKYRKRALVFVTYYGWGVHLVIISMHKIA